jgi:hypothetical protein
MYITSCIYSVGQSTQFLSAVVDALSTAIPEPTFGFNGYPMISSHCPCVLCNLDDWSGVHLSGRPANAVSSQMAGGRLLVSS